MHDYAIFGHSRATIGRWLGVSSIIFTGFISSLLVWLYQATQIQAFATAVVTPAIIYFFFFIFLTDLHGSYQYSPFLISVGAGRLQVKLLMKTEQIDIDGMQKSILSKHGKRYV
ncbi:hypothetical protein UXP31_21120 [Enterobacter mori]